MNGAPMTTAQASIRTASVEIRALTVSGKRMTVAVFRQLPEVRLLEPWLVSQGATDEQPGGAQHIEVRLGSGDLWGTVNYHQGCDPRPHLHVVLVRGGTLYQGLVFQRPERHLFWMEGLGNLAVYNPGAARQLSDDYDAYYARLEALPQLYIAV